MDVRKLAAELLGTAALVFFAVGVATLSFGFVVTGRSTSAGVVATALAFGLVLLILAYALGPISGCHINPAVTLGFLVARRIPATEALAYWVAQIVGAIIGAGVLRAMFGGATGYSTKRQGLGTNGYGAQSMIHLNAGGAFLAEVLLTFLFVFVVLAVTRKAAWPQLGGVAIGFALATVHLIGIPLTGTSVNPARSIGPALFVGGTALSQLWLFIVAPLIGGAIAALISMLFYGEDIAAPEAAAEAGEPPTITSEAGGAPYTDRGPERGGPAPGPPHPAP
jgi:aquaporin Z